MNYIEFPRWGDFQLKGEYPASEWVYDVIEIIGTVGCSTIDQAISIWEDENPKAWRQPADNYYSYILAKTAVEYKAEDMCKQEDELDYGGRFLATEKEHNMYNILKHEFEVA